MLKRCAMELKLKPLGSRISEIVPDYIKKGNMLEEFKSKVKLWNPENCACRICKRFLPQVGSL